jgi:sulfite exporter TauE/SafE
MIELPLVFLGGLLGSSHCVGMCGGLAVAIGGSAGLRRNFARQLVYSLGRIFTYAALGGGLGYAGLRLAEDLPAVIRAQGTLAIAAGVLLVAFGLIAAGVVPRRWRRVVGAGSNATVGPACLTGGLIGAFLRAPGWGSIFLAGVFTGFLPCGLVYGFLALACSTASFTAGLATMAAFGLGTVPLLVLTGTGVSLVSIVTRRRLLRAAAWCVVLAGLVSLARGALALTAETAAGPPPCPACGPAS